MLGLFENSAWSSEYSAVWFTSSLTYIFIYNIASISFQIVHLHIEQIFPFVSTFFWVGGIAANLLIQFIYTFRARSSNSDVLWFLGHLAQVWKLYSIYLPTFFYRSRRLFWILIWRHESTHYNLKIGLKSIKKNHLQNKLNNIFLIEALHSFAFKFSKFGPKNKEKNLF